MESLICTSLYWWTYSLSTYPYSLHIIPKCRFNYIRFEVLSALLCRAIRSEISKENASLIGKKNKIHVARIGATSIRIWREGISGTKAQEIYLLEIGEFPFMHLLKFHATKRCRWLEKYACNEFGMGFCKCQIYNEYLFSPEHY